MAADTTPKRPRMSEAAYIWVATRMRLALVVEALRGETDPEIKSAVSILAGKLAEMDDHD